MEAIIDNYDSRLDRVLSIEEGEYVMEMLKQQQEIVLKRLNENNLLYEYRQDKHRMFKKFKVEKYGDINVLYYNDNSIGGKAIVAIKRLIHVRDYGVRIDIKEVRW